MIATRERVSSIAPSLQRTRKDLFEINKALVLHGKGEIELALEKREALLRSRNLLLKDLSKAKASETEKLKLEINAYNKKRERFRKALPEIIKTGSLELKASSAKRLFSFLRDKKQVDKKQLLGSWSNDKNSFTLKVTDDKSTLEELERELSIEALEALRSQFEAYEELRDPDEIKKALIEFKKAKDSKLKELTSITQRPLFIPEDGIEEIVNAIYPRRSIRDIKGPKENKASEFKEVNDIIRAVSQETNNQRRMLERNQQPRARSKRQRSRPSKSHFARKELFKTPNPEKDVDKSKWPQRWGRIDLHWTDIKKPLSDSWANIILSSRGYTPKN